MTREEFLNQHKHEFAGLVLDAVTSGRKGAELSLWLKTVMFMIDAKLNLIFDQLQPAPPGPMTRPPATQEPKNGHSKTNGNGSAPATIRINGH